MRGVECTWEPPGELPIPRALGSQQISSTEEHADVKGDAQALVPPDHGPRTLHRRIPRYPASARVGFEALRAESREWRLDPPGGFLRKLRGCGEIRCRIPGGGTASPQAIHRRLSGALRIVVLTMFVRTSTGSYREPA